MPDLAGAPANPLPSSVRLVIKDSGAPVHRPSEESTHG